MTNIDQFESVFKAADKPQFKREAIALERIVTVTDLDTAASQNLADRVRHFLGDAASESAEWTLVPGDSFSTVEALLTRVSAQSPDLVCTYRNVHTPAPDYPYSLGVYVDVLTQATDLPVLLLPNPHVHPDNKFASGGRDAVMAITDHLTGDHHLVSYAAALTESSGKLVLAHVEDEAVFERFIETIGRIPTIDTDLAREEILHQLLQEPHDYVRSCRRVLEEAGGGFEIEEIVAVGHRLSDYKRLVEERDIDLLVLNTKDDDQLAMHGVAYPLAIELREVPMLLL